MDTVLGAGLFSKDMGKINLHQLSFPPLQLCLCPGFLFPEGMYTFNKPSEDALTNIHLKNLFWVRAS